MFGNASSAYLVELVYGAANGPDLICGDPAYLEDAIQDLPVVDLDSVLSLPLGQIFKYLLDDPQYLSVWQHGVVLACNVKVALVELAHTAFRHGRLVSSVDLGDVVAFDVLRRILGAEAREGNGEVVAQRADLAALVGKVVDELAVFAIFAGECLSELEDGSNAVSIILPGGSRG